MSGRKWIGVVCAILLMAASLVGMGATDGPTIGAAFFVTANYYSRTLIQGLTDVIEDAGGTLIVADARGDWQTRSNDIENFIAQGVDGIVIQTGFPAQIQPVVEKALAAGIEVVTTNIGYLEGVSTTVVPNHFVIGVLVGAQIIYDMEPPYEGLVYAFLDEGVFDFEERIKGIQLVFSEYPGLELKKVDVPDDPSAMVPDTMAALSALILAHPSPGEIRAVYGAADFFAVGPYQALLAANRDDILVYGSDGDEVALLAIRDETDVWVATVARKPYDDGYMAAQYLLKAIAGEEVPTQVKSDFYLVTEFDIVDRVDVIYGEGYWAEIGWED